VSDQRTGRVGNEEAIDVIAREARAQREGAAVKRLSDRAVLRETAARMHGDDLDAAWVAALRGDVSLALSRMAPSVPTRRVKARKGKRKGWRSTPWSMKGKRG
jgi:hypothetical protein